MSIEDFDFHLPEQLIAQQPVAERGASRLLHLGVAPASERDLQFNQLPELLRSGDLLVLNNTRVVKARFKVRKASGGRAEVLLERALDGFGGRRFLAQVRASRAPGVGSVINFGNDYTAKVLGRQDDLFELELNEGELQTLISTHGALPLPPYIQRPPTAEDEARYQTIYAKHQGAVAAPTAGLHFDQPLLDQLIAKGVEVAYLTLHVGAGTFAPVRMTDPSTHKMHAEQVVVDSVVCEQVAATRARGGRVVAVGTTCVRALESAALEGGLKPFKGDTAIFIFPGFKFQVVDVLISNFHLPRSTLLMLVSAFAGRERVLAAYQHAVNNAYRFFSYGDAMLMERQEMQHHGV
jgi:S-adenosylmethionine:tRNA ribosyltransferase-isomerase